MVDRYFPRPVAEVIDEAFYTLEERIRALGAVHRQHARAAIYLRSNQYAEHDDLLDQEEACRAYIAETPWTLTDTHVYADTLLIAIDSIYGPAFKKMSRAMRAHEFDVLVVATLDCVSRDHKSIDRFIDDADQAGVPIVSVNRTP